MINTIDTKVPSTSKLISETQCNSEKQNIKKNIEDLIIKYLILVAWLKRLIDILKHNIYKDSTKNT